MRNGTRFLRCQIPAVLLLPGAQTAGLPLAVVDLLPVRLGNADRQEAAARQHENTALWFAGAVALDFARLPGRFAAPPLDLLAPATAEANL